MRTLVIDSATESCSVALFENEVLIAGEFRQLGRGHAEALVPMIAALPDRGKADHIVASLGPGSFTGVRVGLAAARALALAWQVEVSGYSTLSLVAAMARDMAGNVPADVVMTGGHGEWFVESFDEFGRSNAALASYSASDAVNSCHAALVAGSQAEALVMRRGFGSALPIWPDARSFTLLPQHAIMSDTSPLYGRAPDAKLPQARP